MALEYVKKWFSKVGRGVPQTHQVNEDGALLFVDSKGKETTTDTGKPLIGNEQYQADQLKEVPFKKNDEDDPEVFIEAALEATSGSLQLVAESFLSGFNKHLRLAAGGLDEYQKAARKCMDLPWAKGLSLEEVAEKLRQMNQ